MTELRQMLEALGSTPRQVAQTLTNKGIELTCRNHPRRSQSCPVARYLKEQFPDQHGIYVNNQWAFVGMPGEPLPDPVSNFVAFFDLRSRRALPITPEDFPDE
jgi:hypothetical protein